MEDIERLILKALELVVRTTGSNVRYCVRASHVIHLWPRGLLMGVASSQNAELTETFTTTRLLYSVSVS
jgi:hypothetical protein